jgi:adenine phosphoribosyltransferase
MGEQENNKIGGSGNNAMAVDESGAAANKGKSLGAAADPRLQAISDAIRVVPHFPKPGPPPSSPTPTYNQSFG